MSPKKTTSKKKPVGETVKPTEVPHTVPDAECEDLSEKVLERLPHLAAEIKTAKANVTIDGVRWEETNRTGQVINTGKPRYSGYSPDVIDFLRRCSTNEEAMEIIAFLEERGEIKPVHAKELRKQLQSKGIRSFGSKKIWGHYERES
ncbi:MAG: DUF2095 family protein [Candidatus Hodarchaeota archaeon]